MDINKTKDDMVEALQISLKFIRPLLGLTVQGIADYIGVTRQTINNLENNKSKMTITQYIAICAVIDNKCKVNNEILEKIKQIIVDNSNLELDMDSNKLFLDTWFSIFSSDISKEGDQKCELTLLATTKGYAKNIIGISTTKGQVHAAAGLNWGYSSGAPLLGDAYIPINKDDILKSGQMFIKPSNVNIPIKAIWDDGKEMTLLLEGVRFNSSDNKIYPKQISSYKNKSEIGNYLRKRIGDKIGKDLEFSQDTVKILSSIKSRNNKNKDAIVEEINKNSSLITELSEKFISLSDLKKYGRTTVTVRLKEGVYYFDFSV